MNLRLDTKNISNYKSNSQKIRILTEDWFLKNMYCPCCLKLKINDYPNNMKGYDFFCKNCNNNFQLKSSMSKFKKRVLDGEYNTMKKIILNNQSPNLFLLHYDLSDLHVKDLILIPKFFVSFSILERRNPLSQNAKRAGWTGCNFIIDRLPNEGKINIIKDEKILDKNEINKIWRKMFFMALEKPSSRGWTSDVLKIVDELQDKFTLQDMYKYESYFKEIHPENHNIKPK